MEVTDPAIGENNVLNIVKTIAMTAAYGYIKYLFIYYKFTVLVIVTPDGR